MLYDAILDALAVSSKEAKAPVDATFSWYFRDEDRWLTVVSRGGAVSVRPGLTDDAEMKFYSACVADFIHQHTTEGAGKTIFQGGGFYWKGDISLLKEISPLCRNLFGPGLHQRLVGAGISVPKFEVRRYPARTKAQRDRILAEWIHQGEPVLVARRSSPPKAMATRAVSTPASVVSKAQRVVKGATKTARSMRAAKTVTARKPRPSAAAVSNSARRA